MFQRVTLRMLLFGLAASCALPSRAAAECGPRPVEACALVNNDAEIFIGRVLPQNGGDLEWKMRVVRSFRGTARGVIAVNVWSTGDLPSPATLETGKDYLFYVSKETVHGKTVRSTALACGTWLPLEDVSRGELDFLARLGGNVLEGRVFGSLGRQTGVMTREPLAGVRIFLRSASGTFSTVTDSQGTFEIGGLPAGTYTVATTVPPELLVKVNGPVELVPHGCTYAYLIAEPNTIISGRVTLPRGFAVKDTQVAALDTTGRLVDSTYADASGHYVLAGLKPGEYLVSLWTLGLPPDADAPFLQTFAPGTTDRTRATRIRIEGPSVFQNVDIPVTAQELATITVTSKDEQGRSVPDASMDVTFGGGLRGVGKGDDSGVVRVRIVKGVRLYLLGAGMGGCMVPLVLGPDDYPASLDVAFTRDGCRETNNLQHRASLAAQTGNRLDTRRIRVTYPDGTPASDAQVSIGSRPPERPLISAFRSAPDGSLDLPFPLQTEFYIYASRFASGIACQSGYVWFNTRGQPRWQRRATRDETPDWTDGTSFNGEVVLRLEGSTCRAQ